METLRHLSREDPSMLNSVQSNSSSTQPSSTERQLTSRERRLINTKHHVLNQQPSVIAAHERISPGPSYVQLPGRSGTDSQVPEPITSSQTMEMMSSDQGMTSSLTSSPDITYNRTDNTEDERVVQAILVSHNGPQSFPQIKDRNHKSLGSPYVKITEQDGKFDSWVVLPLTEFQDIYHNNIDLVRKHLFGAVFAKTSCELGVFPCEDCGYVYNKDYNLRRHRKEKHAILIKRVKCPYCQKFYLREDNLIRHVRNVHNQDERCVCIHCGAEFFRYHTLKRHILTKHKESKAHQCNLCNKTFAYKWEIKIHIKNSHTLDPGYTCDVCNKKYKRPQSLEEHKRFYHQGHRVICKIDNCNELFNTMANFKRHKREMHVVADTVTKRGPTQTEERFKSYEIVPVESLGEFRCSECGVLCTSSKELQKHFKKEHAMKHTRIRRTASVLYKCNQCATTFKEKGSYESHCMKFHSSLSPEVPVQYPFGKGATTCCDGVCDASGLDLSVTSQLLAMDNDHLSHHHGHLLDSRDHVTSASPGVTSLLHNPGHSGTSMSISQMQASNSEIGIHTGQELSSVSVLNGGDCFENILQV